MTKKNFILFALLSAVILAVPAFPAWAEDQDVFFSNLNENIRTKPSSLFGGLTGTEFMTKMKEKYGREQTTTLFSVMSPETELSGEKAREIVDALTPEKADGVIAFYTLAMREAGVKLNQDDLAAKKAVALVYNDLAAKYLAGERDAVELCEQNYGPSAKAKMTVMMRLSTMFLEHY